MKINIARFARKNVKRDFKKGLIGLWGVTRLASGNSLKSQACRILVARFLAVLQWLAADFFFALQSKPRRRSSFPELSHLRPTSAREHFLLVGSAQFFPAFFLFLSIFCEKKLHPFCLQNSHWTPFYIQGLRGGAKTSQTWLNVKLSRKKCKLCKSEASSINF